MSAKIAIGIGVLVAVIGGVALASGKKKTGGGSGGGGSGGSGGGGSGGGGKPGGTNKPKPKPGGGKPKPKPTPKPRTRGSGTIRGQQDYPPGGLIWGTPMGDYTFISDPLVYDNFIMIGKDCTWVIEGPSFRPAWTAYGANDDMDYNKEATPLGRNGDTVTSLEESLSMNDYGNTVWGYVDALEMRDLDAKATVMEIVNEVSPMCASVGPEQWGDGGVSGGMYGWFEDFMAAIDNWRTGIEFGGEDVS